MKTLTKNINRQELIKTPKMWRKILKNDNKKKGIFSLNILKNIKDMMICMYKYFFVF